MPRGLRIPETRDDAAIREFVSSTYRTPLVVAHEATDIAVSCNGARAVAHGDAAIAVAHEPSDLARPANRACAVAGNDASDRIRTHESSDILRSVDPSGAVAGGDGAAILACQGTEISISCNGAGAVAGGNQSVVEANKAADAGHSRDGAGAVACGDPTVVGICACEGADCLAVSADIDLLQAKIGNHGVLHASEQTEMASPVDRQMRNGMSVAVKNTRERDALKKVLDVIDIRCNNGPVEDLTARQIGVQIDVRRHYEMLVIVLGTLTQQD